MYTLPENLKTNTQTNKQKSNKKPANKEAAHNINISTNYGRTTKIGKICFTYLHVILSLVFNISMILVNNKRNDLMWTKIMSI